MKGKMCKPFVVSDMEHYGPFVKNNKKTKIKIFAQKTSFRDEKPTPSFISA
jgi:hypothetical protein